MKKVLLCILDGFGYREENHGNAILKAYKPNYDHLWKTYPHALLEASGELVGLPKGQMGNSEVGHTNLGAGRIVYQPLQLITKHIEDGTFFANEQFLDVLNHVKDHQSKLHIYGMLSDGGVHSHISHILALLDLCAKEQVFNVYLHMFTDGRDTLPNVCQSYFDILEKKIEELGFGTLATISGRYYAMDRDKRWDRLKVAYDAIVNGVGPHYQTYQQVIEDNYQKGFNDEFILPSILNDGGTLEENDGIFFANFRPDRATEILTAITNPEFQEMEVKHFSNLKVVTMMPCVASVLAPSAFREEELKNTLGEYISKLGFTQLRIAETEKYAHVTYFFDGGIERNYDGCTKLLIPSPKEVKTYDQKPEMSIYEVTDTLLIQMEKDYNLIVLNFANCDMVGHTGNMDATIKAVEAVDDNLGRVFKKAQELDYTMVVIADHGNADMMLDEENHIITSHTTSLVPCIITDNNYTVQNGKLGDVAPTILSLMKIQIPEEMTGKVLIS